MKNPISSSLGAVVLLGASITALAAPVKYEIDPTHTYPSFEADHMGGLSIWRGKFTRTSGSITLDAAAKTGSLDVTIDVASVDFGNVPLEEHARKPELFDVEKFPTATYKGRFTKFNGATPTEVEGELTLHGVTKPVKLVINQFMCRPHPVNKVEVCGADASATIDRKEFGIDLGASFGFRMAVKLQIQVEALKAG